MKKVLNLSKRCLAVALVFFVVPSSADLSGTALIVDGDTITIDAESNSINLGISNEELAKRKEQWTAPDLKVSRGVLFKYAKTVSSASQGCVTDEF